MVRRLFWVISTAAVVGIFLLSLLWPGARWLYAPVLALVGLGVYDIVQRRHTLLRIYPVIGHGRYLMEGLRPEIQQYFVENNLDGRPFNRTFRSVVYQRSKGAPDKLPFGTQWDVYEPGYEWIHHSLAPHEPLAEAPRLRIGGPACGRPYEASYLNISAMSFGSLSAHAIEALNRAAKMGGFAHNTGEGGISDHHLAGGGDLVFQLGTAYFGARTPEGRFDPERFRDQASRDVVKMVEIKLSQGAKPGHGGILPREKITGEIARIRGVGRDRDVVSPPAHSAFDSPRGLLEFVARLRDLAGGKPIGFKLCLGDPAAFLSLCKAMVETQILPDFITVDGAEGGTGAAPVEFTNSVGMPLQEGLVWVDRGLRGIGVRDRVRVLAAGKVATGFHMLRLLALGADACNAARAMMLALGCIQARRCHENTCPVGVATTDPLRTKALDIEDKAERVARFHRATIRSMLELLAAAGLDSPDEVTPRHLWRRIDGDTVRSFEEIYPSIEAGCLLDDAPPPWMARSWTAATPAHF